MGRPRYIIGLQNGLAEIYHRPSEWVGRDISIPLHSGSAEIYPFPFTVGRPGYIHSPSQRVGRDISTPLQNGSAEIYPFPITAGQPGTQDISPPSQGWPA